MDFYVSGSIRHKAAAREIFSTLKSRGHRITHDWTITDPIGNKFDNLEESGKRAVADLNGVRSADIFVLDSNNDLPGKFMYGELCAALMCHELVGKPSRIFIIGPLNHASIVYFHPTIERVGDIYDVLRALE